MHSEAEPRNEDGGIFEAGAAVPGPYFSVAGGTLISMNLMLLVSIFL